MPLFKSMLHKIPLLVFYVRHILNNFKFAATSIVLITDANLRKKLLLTSDTLLSQIDKEF